MNYTPALFAAFALGLSAQPVAGASSIRFDRLRYDILPGQTVLLLIQSDNPPETGLFSYGVQGSWPAGSASVESFSVNPALDFNGLRGPGGISFVASGSFGLKGTVDFLQQPIKPYIGNSLGSITLSDRGGSTYEIVLSPFNTLGATEDLFVAGDRTKLDPGVTFGRALINHQPGVTLSSPGAESVFYSPLPVTFEATAFDVDSDGGISRVDFFADGEKVGEAFTPPFHFDWTEGELGSHVLTAVAFDNLGAAAISPEINIQILTNHPPVLTPLVGGFLRVDDLFAATATALDPDSADLLTYFLSSFPIGMTIDSVSGAILWTPTALQTGIHQVTVVVMDNGTPSLSSELSFTIEVFVNHAPTIDDIADRTLRVDDPLAVLPVAVDPDGDALSYSLTQSPATMTIVPTTGAIAWTPTAGDTGNHAVTVRVTDNGRPTLVAQTSFTVVVLTNHVPTLEAIADRTLRVDDPLAVQPVALDPDGDALTYSLTQSPATMTIVPTTGAIAWTPTAADTGNHAVTVRVTDNGRPTLFAQTSFTVVVLTNHVPTIDAIADRTLRVDDPLTVQPVALDPDGDALTYSLTQSPATMTVVPTTGAIAWTPMASDTGNHMVTVRVTDNGRPTLFAQTSFTVIVLTNHVPTIDAIADRTLRVDDLLAVQPVAADPDNDTLIYSLTQSPAAMTIVPATGAIAWTPIATDTGNHVVTVRATDNGRRTLFAQTSFTVIVLTNHVPTIGAIADRTLRVADSLAVQPMAADPDNDTLTYSLTQSPPAMTIVPATGAIAWAPTAADTGNHAITVRVTDNGRPVLFAQSSFTVIVVSNRPPTVAPVADQFVKVGALLSVSPVVADPDGNNWLFALTAGPPGLAVNPVSGFTTWTPALAQVGNHDVVIRITDDGRPPLSTNLAFRVIVLTNRPPQLPALTDRTVRAGELLTVQVLGTDPDGDTLSYSLTSPPAGAVIDPITGVITWTPTTAQAGNRLFTVVLRDNGQPQLSVSGVFTVVVTTDPPPTSPTAVFVGVSSLTAQQKALRWGGSRNRANGRVHSNSGILALGQNHVFQNGPVEHVTGISPANNFGGRIRLQNSSLVTSAVQNYPVTYSLSEFAPGGQKAAAAASQGKYYVINGNTDLNDYRHGNTLREGLYYVRGKVDLRCGNLQGRITIVATNSINIRANQSVFSAFSSCLLFYSSKSTSNSQFETFSQHAISFDATGQGGSYSIQSGGNSEHSGQIKNRYQGVVYAPNGGISFLSERDTVVFGSVVGRNVYVDAEDLVISGMDPNVCPPLVAAITPTRKGNNYCLNFGTVLGIKYYIERSDSLLLNNWQPLTATIGDGRDQTLSLGSEVPQRFYRLRIE